MKKYIVFILILLLFACKHPNYKEIKILILSMNDLNTPIKIIPKEKYNIKIASGPFFSYLISNKKLFFKKINELNKLQLDAYIPVENFTNYNFNMFRNTVDIPNFELLQSDCNRYKYKKYFKQFVLKNYIEFRLIFFCIDQCNPNLMVNPKIAYRPTDIKIIFINNKNYSLGEFLPGFNIFIYKKDISKDYKLSNDDKKIELILNEKKDIQGIFTIQYDIKSKTFVDSDFDEL